MLHTYYYVNGQRVSMERYVAVADNKAYMEAAFKKAKEYFECHQGEWFMLCSSTPEDILPLAMVTKYERTPEGKAFQKEWNEKQRKRTKIWFVLGLILLAAPIIAGIISLLIYGAKHGF